MNRQMRIILLLAGFDAGLVLSLAIILIGRYWPQ